MDALQAVGDPQLRSALLWARGRAHPVSADDLAASQKIHRNVARSRLERLADAGLLVASYERRTGRTGPGAGRPAKVYAVPPQLDAIEFPARHYEWLIGSLIDNLPARDRLKRLRSIGVEFGLLLARAGGIRPAKRVTAGFERMCEAVGALGFQASVVEVTDDHAVIATPTCPLRPLVQSQPEAVEVDRGMWAGLAAAALADVDVARVRCETRDCLDRHASCRVLIELRTK